MKTALSLLVAAFLAACSSPSAGPVRDGGATSSSAAGGSSGGASSAGTGGGSSSGGSSGGSSSGGIDGGNDAGVDAGPDGGCTPGDGGDCPFCGAGNFAVVCPLHLGTCPRDSVCAGSACDCDEGFVGMHCGDAGECTSANPCSYPDWWCAPREPGPCGPQNFTVPCPDGRGGVAYFPTHGSCGSAGSFGGCASGYVDLSCSGEPCSVQACTAPDWWCAPLDAGACGAQNFTTPCPDGDGGTFYCPANGSCAAGGGCGCQDGYIDVTCAGEPCTETTCSYPGWWCTPGTLACGALNDTVWCTGAGGSLYRCPANGLCFFQGCACNPGYSAIGCDGVPCGDGGCGARSWWCVDAG
ncbi:MAG: hypothetical protein ACYDCL_13575 [Myxococcales bacterium]